ncbi:hypothetical protein GM415_01380 [Pseudodesulfovibrio cashew]|uniref:Inositolphosphotransferase Aur1/Ipt1 domain-containing protein n=1 Tax=Pseudodesulfovibrio cashew TaxID=2678688 RepID=A0A6I6JMF3_9BACT|nr:phosphatase PAP2 family protein [Pseudodesulfovibrio cashew]QGY38844.1 hypothetical protein GM415_01380 [Pseudodesulfovibrio cashew]
MQPNTRIRTAMHDITRAPAARPAEIAAHHIRTVAASLLDSLWRHRFLAALSAVYALFCGPFAKMFGVEHLVDYSVGGQVGIYLMILTLVCFLILHCLRTQWRDRPKRLLPHVAKSLKNDFLSYDRLFHGIIAIACLYLLMAVFSNYKRMIPFVVPFHLDAFLHNLDKTLHFGMEPWRLLQPLLGHPLISFAINFLYNIWLFLVVMVFYWQAFSRKDPALRMQFLSSFLLCWVIVGTVAATLLSSAGPCFYGLVTSGADPYAPLMDYLRTANETYPIWALSIQDTLYQSYTQSSLTVVSGISAMPSMHISIATLMALLGWRIGRVAGWGFTAYCGCIMLGSVHLGWHYAVDGYVSVIMTLAIWHACGWFTGRASGNEPKTLSATL